MDTPPDRHLVTELLRQWGSGDKQALDRLMPVVYDQLRKLASRALRAERPDHTLATTALVHEAYLHLVDANIALNDRAHFFAVSARILRRILVEHARSHSRAKRGGGLQKVELDEAVVVGPVSSDRVLELDEALQRLATLDPRKSEIVELLCFGGLTYDETAAALEISPATVHRELTMAKAWLHRELTRTS
ncbi:MAG: sigma-70 family RNA polymerase sigma factor [Silvibacterium sp.]|nr:sigma-70 family RNA polymerase sigma factor [Silvibacterium sp.]